MEKFKIKPVTKTNHVDIEREVKTIEYVWKEVPVKKTVIKERPVIKYNYKPEWKDHLVKDSFAEKKLISEKTLPGEKIA